MTIKLKDLTSKGAPGGGKELFRQFVERAASPRYREDPFWEAFRQRTTPTKFKTVPQMFARWQVLAGITK
jgi:hypothetical protein